MTSLVGPEIGAPDVDVTADEEDRLLTLARLAVAAAARGDEDVARDAGVERIGGRPASQVRRGAAFVTLLEDGELRGCIGLLDPTRPLTESVAGAAIGAVLHDWRFPPVTADELPRLEIQVSVLGSFVALEQPLAFAAGIDGLLVERGGNRGLLLPEVATEHGFDARAMLEATCVKAGLPKDAWQDARTRVFAFRTRRFGGPALT